MFLTFTCQVYKIGLLYCGVTFAMCAICVIQTTVVDLVNVLSMSRSQLR